MVCSTVFRAVRMAKLSSTSSQTRQLAIIALNDAITLHDNIQTLKPWTGNVGKFARELQSLKESLKNIVAIAEGKSHVLDVILRRCAEEKPHVLDVILRQCADSLKEVNSTLTQHLLLSEEKRKEFQGWAALGSACNNIVDLTYVFAAYGSTFVIVRLIGSGVPMTSDIIKLTRQAIIDIEDELASLGPRFLALFKLLTRQPSSQEEPCSWQHQRVYDLLDEVSRLTRPETSDTDDLATEVVASQGRVLKLIDQLMTEQKEGLSQDHTVPFPRLRDEYEALYESLNICIRANNFCDQEVARAARHPDPRSSSGELMGIESSNNEDPGGDTKNRTSFRPLLLEGTLGRAERRKNKDPITNGSLTGDIAADLKTFVEGAERLASICGPERAKYYHNPLKGVHSIDSFKDAFNQAYPKQAITSSDMDIQLQCPPSWSIRFEETTGWSVVLTYEGEGPLTQGIDDVMNGPTVIDCGMWCQLLLWMAIRFLLGDDVFNQTFRFEKGKFALTQSWGLPMNKECTDGDLLNSFYDEPGADATHYRVHTRTVCNDAAYLSKHPGGTTRLENFVKIGDRSFVFGGTGCVRNVLSDEELDAHLRHSYNAPQHLADRQKIHQFYQYPHIQHPFYGPISFGTLASRADMYAHHTLDEAEWKARRVIREELSRDHHLVFNFGRMLAFVKEKVPDYLTIRQAVPLAVSGR
ncbi:hypothetical protein AU210_016330 [Fusarium oxysporum f. sp. radicis-cucumerinum]|uniref:Azaphilone pigments biosynthesis cluster protein L N-terminal domain-containing protein n=1 Tax=Fusarium oxysporum f. sp. radicis-cucumerinum TaxID=327505 RepID=A0A2H3FNW5_FUSOX|nr:hypothetical protein AU210_016330 [Fusarium oxysporum f. sp. radicis-cucumerinum]